MTTQAPGKRDFITFNKLRKQKQYLQNSMLHLHRKFCDENPFIISYSLFCQLRPFWVIRRKITERDTCLCIQHENMDLLTKRLYDQKILSGSSIDKLIDEQMCCPKDVAISKQLSSQFVAIQ